MSRRGRRLLRLALSHRAAPGILGGYLAPPMDDGRERLAAVGSLAGASRAMRAFVRRHILVPGNLGRRAGEVRDARGRLVARIGHDGGVMGRAGPRARDAAYPPPWTPTPTRSPARPWPPRATSP